MELLWINTTLHIAETINKYLYFLPAQTQIAHYASDAVGWTYL